MRKENIKRARRATQDNDDSWVDVHDDVLMVELGIRPPVATPRDESLWRNTPHEQEILKNMRRIYKLDDSHFHYPQQKVIPVKAKLIIYLKKNNKFVDSVHSITCWQHEINSILLRFHQFNRKENRNENLVSKYVYNGKTYKPEERPFWFGK